MASIRGVHGSERLLIKLRKLIDNRDYYEAHQLYRTLNFRYSNSGKHEELRQLLFDGATLFLANGQLNSGSDLAGLYLEALGKDPLINEGNKLASDSARSCANCRQSNRNLAALQNEPSARVVYVNIGHLFSRLPASTAERMQYTIKALKLDASKFDIPRLHQQFALVLWKEKNYPESRYHFLRAPEGSGDDCASMLIEYHISSGFGSEVDMFIAQFILQLLCLKTALRTPVAVRNPAASDADKLVSLDNVKVQSMQHAYANRALQSFTARHPRIKRKNPPYVQPLLNFLWFLLIAIDRYVALPPLIVGAYNAHRSRRNPHAGAAIPSVGPHL